MRTTLVISDPIYERARREAQKKGMPVSALVTEAIEEFLVRAGAKVRPEKPSMVRLPSFSMGAARADIDNREELYRAMEER